MTSNSIVVPQQQKEGEKETSVKSANRDAVVVVEEVKKEFGKELRKEFLFDTRYLNLNHGSFGTYPASLRPTLHAFQAAAEARPDVFIRYQYPTHLDASRAAIATLLNAPVDTCVFVPNATTGVNIVLRNLVYQPGDYILYTSTIYGACHKTIDYICETTPAEAVCVGYELPVEDEWLVQEFRRVIGEVEKKGGRVKVALFDTVVSMPGVRLPFERLVEVCRELGVLSLVDGAHGVGHVELDIGKLDADFFVSNCHKWLFVPRGCAIFHVPLRNQHLLRSTLPTSHGFQPLPKPGQISSSNPLPAVGQKSPFVKNFEFVGTIDNSPYLCIPAAIAYRKSLGGESAIIAYNTKLARAAAYRAAKILGTEALDNSTQTLTACCLSNTKLPLSFDEIAGLAGEKGVGKEEVAVLVAGWIQQVLVGEHETFMAIAFHAGAWWVRWSAQVYLELSDFEWAAETLKGVCERVERGEWVPEVEESKL